MDSRQLKVCATCFDLSVSLLRVLEMTVTLAPEIFLDWNRPSSELLLRRLAQVLAFGREGRSFLREAVSSPQCSQFGECQQRAARCSVPLTLLTLQSCAHAGDALLRDCTAHSERVRPGAIPAHPSVLWVRANGG